MSCRSTSIFALLLVLGLSAVGLRAQDTQKDRDEVERAMESVSAYIDSRRPDVKELKPMSRRELLLIKRDAAKIALRQLTLQIENGALRLDRIDLLVSAHRRLMDAEVALAGTKAERVKAIGAYVTAMRELAAIMKSRAQIDATMGDVMNMGAALADAELLLMAAAKE